MHHSVRAEKIDCGILPYMSNNIAPLRRKEDNMKKLLAAVAAAACALAAGLTACAQPEETGTYSVEAELSC